MNNYTSPPDSPKVWKAIRNHVSECECTCDDLIENAVVDNDGADEVMVPVCPRCQAIGKIDRLAAASAETMERVWYVNFTRNPTRATTEKPKS